MSSIPQNHFDENDLIDCVQRFFSKHHVGKLLARCNGMKEKGVSPVSLLRYKLSNIFVGRSMYMQQRTGSFKEDFSKNTFYRFLNSVKTNWLRFTSLLAADIVNNDLKDLTDDNRKNVFIIDDSLFNRTSCKKTVSTAGIVALCCRNGGSQTPDRWLNESRNPQFLKIQVSFGYHEWVSMFLLVL